MDGKTVALMVSIKRYHTSDEKEWNDFITESKNGLFFFNRSYLDYHADRFTDHSLMLYVNDKLLALLPASEHGKEIVSHGGLTYGGLIMSYQLKAAQVIDIVKEIIHYYQQAGFNTLLYKAVPAIFHRYPSQEDLYALFIHNASLYRRDLSSTISLNDPIRYSETKRQLVAKCIKAGISVSESEDYTLYWNILNDALKKHGTTAVHSLEEITLLHSRFPEKIKLFAAFDNAVMIAGIIVYDFDTVVHTQYMASTDEGRKAGALDFINHNLIIEQYKDRAYYNFGISTVNNGRELNEGLVQQKELMGGRAVVYDFYKIVF